MIFLMILSIPSAPPVFILVITFVVSAICFSPSIYFLPYVYHHMLVSVSQLFQCSIEQFLILSKIVIIFFPNFIHDFLFSLISVLFYCIHCNAFAFYYLGTTSIYFFILIKIESIYSIIIKKKKQFLLLFQYIIMCRKKPYSFMKNQDSDAQTATFYLRK